MENLWIIPIMAAVIVPVGVLVVVIVASIICDLLG